LELSVIPAATSLKSRCEETRGVRSEISDLVLFIVGGLLFLGVGMALVLGVEIPHPFSLALIVAGAMVIVLALIRGRPRASAVLVFLLGLLVLASSGFSYIWWPAQQETKVVTLTKADMQVSEITMSAKTAAGNVEIGFSDDDALLCEVTVWYYKRTSLLDLGASEEPTITHEKTGDMLSVNVENSAGNIHVVIGPSLRSSINLSVAAGNIDVISTRAHKVERIEANTVAGNVHISLEADSLRLLSATTVAGNVECSLVLFGTQGAHAIGHASLGTASVEVPEGSTGTKTENAFDLTTPDGSAVDPIASVNLEAAVGNINLSITRGA